MNSTNNVMEKEKLIVNDNEIIKTFKKCLSETAEKLNNC